MFLKKLLSFATKKETLVYDNATFKMYDIMFEGKKATKIVLTATVLPYELLKKIKHDNIIHPKKLSVNKKYLVTCRLYPFNKYFKKEALEYTRFCLYKIAEALEFLHVHCSIAHRNLTLDALFFDEEGKIVLGGFEKAGKDINFDDDKVMFTDLVYKLLKENVTFKNYIENKGNCDNFFFDLELAIFAYRSYNIEQKSEFINNLKRHSKDLIEPIRAKVAGLIFIDLQNEATGPLRLEITNFIIFNGPEENNEYIIKLFSILDTDVRLTLLKKSEHYIHKIKSFDPIIKDLVVGLKCNEIELIDATIEFIEKNIHLMSEPVILKILDVIYDYIGDDASVILVLNFFKRTKPAFKDNDVIYKTLCKFLLMSECKPMVLDTIEIFYPSFNPYKIGTELLPLLCAYISDRKLQSQVFSLIEKILNHLKEHKNEIIKKEWSISGLKGFFVQKEEKASNKPAYEFSDPNYNNKREESETEWDDEW